MTDQQRAELCAREGFPVDATPTLDRLARDGRWFDRAYTASPLCVPARVSLLTGRYPSAHGVRGNDDQLDPRCERDLFDVMRAAGYRTALIGKNHSHLRPGRVDCFLEYSHWGRLSPGAEMSRAREFDDWLRRLGPATSLAATPFPVEDQIPSRLVDQAIAWLDEGAGQRSFLWLSIPEPHVPYQAPEPYFSQFGPGAIPEPATGREDTEGKSFAWRHVAELAGRAGEAEPATLLRARANYIGMLRLIDDQISRLVGHLRDTGASEESLLVFLSDHGDFAGEYGLMRKGPELPEALTRIPLFFSGRGVDADPAPSDAHVSIVDVLPTLCDLVGEPVPRGVQGRSLTGVLTGEDPAIGFASAYAEQGVGGRLHTSDGLEAADVPLARPRLPAGLDTIDEVTQSGFRRMVRSGRWKLQVDALVHSELYDLDADPYELHDLHAEPAHQPEMVEMLTLLATWQMRAVDPLPAPRAVASEDRPPRLARNKGRLQK